MFPVKKRLSNKPLSNEQLAARVLWVENLISGKFSQGFGALKVHLRGEYRYCCLGVAGEVLASESMNVNLDGWFLGGPVVDLLGLSESDDRNGDNDQTTASRWNDRNKYSFDRNADLIAYATEHNSRFTDVKTKSVPEGYATEWLKKNKSSQ